MVSSVLINTIILIAVSTVVLLIIFKLLKGKSSDSAKNTILIIGPSQSGKTSFFYHLINKKKIETVVSMQPNELNTQKISFLKNEYDIIDIPGTGYFKDTILEKLSKSKLVLLFVDSTDKSNISICAEYLYDILNSDKFETENPFIIVCNKQDGNFPKTKKMIESELTKEIENIKNIKQKNNLDDNTQIGFLFNLKKKFSFTLFPNISFVECDRTSEYASLTKAMKSKLEEQEN